MTIVSTYNVNTLLTRYEVHMDDHGDAEGNYTLVARFEHHSRSSEFGLYPAGSFIYSSDNYDGLPVCKYLRSKFVGDA